MFDALLLGAGIGLLAVLSPGPVTLALVEIGAARGRRSGLRAGMGVAGADLLMSAVALLLVVAGAELPTSVFDVARLLSVLFLASVGVGLILRPALGPSLVGHLRHPFRSMFAVTALTPSVLGAWIALFMAMPFRNDPLMLAAFGSGGIGVSWLWHLALGGTAGSFGTSFDTGRRTSLARFGGISMLAFAGWTVL